MSSALTVSGLSKRYGRKGTPALDNLSFDLPRGSICGLVGPNGAGKTTLFAVVAGFLRPDSGTVDLLGEGPFRPGIHKGRIGILPQDAELPLQDSPRAFLEHLARLQGFSPSAAGAAASQSIDQVRLSERANQPIRKLSHGMRRRVAAASALIGNPEIVLLDEPMSGLDPAQGQALRGVLMGLRGTTTLLVSSHNLAELEKICDRVLVMDTGRLIREGTVEEVTGSGVVTHWTLACDSSALALLLPQLRATLDGHRFDAQEGLLVHKAPPGVDLDATSVTIAGVLVESSIAIRRVVRGRSLEDSILDDP